MVMPSSSRFKRRIALSLSWSSTEGAGMKGTNQVTVSYGLDAGPGLPLLENRAPFHPGLFPRALSAALATLPKRRTNRDDAEDQHHEKAADDGELDHREAVVGTRAKRANCLCHDKHPSRGGEAGPL